MFVLIGVLGGNYWESSRIKWKKRARVLSALSSTTKDFLFVKWNICEIWSSKSYRIKWLLLLLYRDLSLIIFGKNLKWTIHSNSQTVIFWIKWLLLISSIKERRINMQWISESNSQTDFQIRGAGLIVEGDFCYEKN